MQRHCENGEAIAKYLRTNPKVGKVIWCGFEDHPNHDIARKQMRGFGGMISFILKEDSIEAANEVLKKTKLFSLAESLGGCRIADRPPCHDDAWLYTKRGTY